MATALAEAFVRFRADTSKIKPDVETAADKVDGGKSGTKAGKQFGSGFGRAAGALLGAAAGVAIVKFGRDSVKAFTDAQTSQKELADAFDRFPGQLYGTTIPALQALNTSLQKKTVYDDDAIASGQAVLAQFKLTGSQVESITPLILDYASKTGKDIPSAAQDVGKALLGNAKALKNIGIKYKATGDQMTDTTNITELLRQQVGGFAEKEGTTAAGQAAILKNQFGELEEGVGSKLVPILMTLANTLLSVVGFIQRYKSVLGPITVAVAALAGGIYALTVAQRISAFLTKQQTEQTILYTVASKIAQVATILWRNAMFGLNLVMDANPLTLIIIAVIALVAVIILAYKKSETFRKIVDAVWAAIKTAFTATINFIVNFVKSHWQLLLIIIGGPLGLVVGLVIKHWSAIKAFIAGAVRAVLTAVGWLGSLPGKVGSWFAGVYTAVRNKIGDMITYLRGVPGRIIAAFGKVNTLLYNAGVDLIMGFIHGITSKINDVKNTLGGLTSKLTSWKGPASVDAEILRGSGQLVIRGFIKGLESQYGLVQSSLASLTGTIPGVSVGPASFAGYSTPPPATRGTGLGSVRQPIQLVVDGRTLAEVVVDPLGRIISNRPLP